MRNVFTSNRRSGLRHEQSGHGQLRNGLQPGSRWWSHPGGTFPTGGLGTGNSINAQIDPLNSQGSLTRSADGRFLFAVDAGSNEVSVLAIKGETLDLVDRVPSGGLFPSSVTVHNNLLYVVNHVDATLAGFTVGNDGKLSALAGPRQSSKALHQSRAGQVHPGRDQAGGDRNSDQRHRRPHRRQRGTPRPANEEQLERPRPFGFTFAGQDILIVSEAASNAASSYRIAPDGTLTVVSGSVATTEEAACWVVTNSVADPRFAYVSNAGSGTISGYRIDPRGTLSLLNSDGHTAITRDSHAPIDSAVTSDGQFLYVLTGGFDTNSDQAVPCNKMTISAFRIQADGRLDTLPGFDTVDPTQPRGLAPGSQGIVVT